MSGQVKSVKPCLKQLQQSIQTIMTPTWPSDESEYYIISKYICILTIVHLVQSVFILKCQWFIFCLK